MTRRQQWRRVLDLEASRWSSKSSAELIAALREPQTYEIEFEAQKFQVEVQIIENTDRFIHVLLSVDDGSLPASIIPATTTFICPIPA
jgi:hypothetical protein